MQTDSKSDHLIVCLGTTLIVGDIPTISEIRFRGFYTLLQSHNTAGKVVVGCGTEPADMKRYLDLLAQQRKDLPPKNLETLTSSPNTLGNIAAIESFMDQNPQYRNVTIVTSRFHCMRTRLMVRRSKISQLTTIVSAEHCLLRGARQQRSYLRTHWQLWRVFCSNPTKLLRLWCSEMRGCFDLLTGRYKPKTT